MLLSEYGSANIIDIAYDGLDKPILIQVIDSYFCEKYKINIPTNLVIDKNNYEDGNIVFVEGNRECYICEYIDGELFDNTKDKKIIANINDVKILGRAFSKVDYF